MKMQLVADGMFAELALNIRLKTFARLVSVHLFWMVEERD